MERWVRVNDAAPKSDHYIACYVPEKGYFATTGDRFEAFREEFPEVSHWRVLMTPPED
jgi:hypothetical protein